MTTKIVRRPWSPTEESELIARMERGESAQDIAPDLGRTPNAVAGKALEIRKNGGPKLAVPSFFDCHAAGMTARQAADARRCSVNNAWQFARKNGFQWVKEDPKAHPLSWESLAAQGLTANEAAAKRGLSTAAARNYANSHGFSFKQERKLEAGMRAVSRPAFPRPSFAGLGPRTVSPVTGSTWAATAENENRAMRRNMGMQA